MAKNLMTQNVYDALLEAFREKPGNGNHAARAAHCDPRTARKWWSKGSPRQPEFEPIETVLRREKLEARAALRAMDERERRDAQRTAEQAKRDALEARVQEAKMVRMSRAAAGSVLATALKVQQEGDRLADRVRLQIARKLNTTDAMSEKEGLSLLERISKYAATGVSLVDAAMRLERLSLGEPEHITAMLSGSHDMSPEEAAAEIRASATALARAEELGLLVLDGDAKG